MNALAHAIAHGPATATRATSDIAKTREGTTREGTTPHHNSVSVISRSRVVKIQGQVAVGGWILALEEITQEDEQWRPIPGYERTYRISNLGRVYSIPRPRTPGGIRKVTHDRYGYPMVTLAQDGVQTKRRVHLWVMLAFRGPTPEGQEVRHLDGDSGNPALANLEFGTHAENMADMIRHGRSGRMQTCVRGHARTPDNLTPTSPNGSRGGHCLACRRLAWKAARANG